MFQHNSKSDASEVLRYRVILFSALLVYSGWSFIIKMMEPTIEAYQPLRFAIIGMVLISLLTSFFIKKNLIAYLKASLTICCTVAVLHASWFLYECRAPYIEYCGYIILIGTIISIMPGKKSAACLGLGALAFTIVLSQLDRQWLMQAAFLPVGMTITLIPSLLGTFTRIDHLKEVQAAHQQQEILFSNLEEGVIVFDRNGGVVNFNPAALRLLEVGPEEILNSKFKDEPLMQIGLLAMQSNPTLKNQIVSFEKKNSQPTWFHVNAVSYFVQKNQQLGVVSFTDLTPLKKSQEIISQQQEQLFASAKLSALGEMAAGIAHEINNPLTIIAGKIALITLEIEKGSVQKTPEHLNRIKETVMRIKRIISGLHTFARGGEHEPFKSTNVSAIVSEVLSFCHERFLHHDIEVEVEIPDDLYIECRSGQISQVLLNLVNNATDAVKTAKLKQIKVSAAELNGFIQIKVSDSGDGINEALQNKIMEPFFTTKEVGKGTGLGLSISKGIIKSHDGRLDLVNSVSPTTFLVELPIKHISNVAA